MIGVGLCFNESWFKIYNYFFVANSTIKKKKDGEILNSGQTLNFSKIINQNSQKQKYDFDQ